MALRHWRRSPAEGVPPGYTRREANRHTGPLRMKHAVATAAALSHFDSTGSSTVSDTTASPSTMKMAEASARRAHTLTTNTR
ncbi:hypothetical protein D3C72_1739180 [compost metagenome]